MNNHTPTPWRYINRRINLGDDIAGPDGRLVAKVLFSKDFFDLDASEIAKVNAEGEANAALIVRAVNAHDALVKIAEQAIEQWEFIASDSESGGRDEEAENARANVREITVALKLARGES